MDIKGKKAFEGKRKELEFQVLVFRGWRGRGAGEAVSSEGKLRGGGAETVGHKVSLSLKDSDPSRVGFLLLSTD